MSIATVTGLVKIEETPVPNHYHNGVIYNSVKVSSHRSDANSKVDYLRLYFEDGKFDNEIFKVGNLINYSGELIKSKITESLSDIAVSLTSAKTATQEELVSLHRKYSYVMTGSILNMTGTLIKINKETASNDLTSISILVMAEAEENRRVIAKLTGIGKVAEIIKNLNKGDTVAVTAKIYSYQVKNRPDLSDYYLHDSRILTIKKVEE